MPGKLQSHTSNIKSYFSAKSEWREQFYLDYRHAASTRYSCLYPMPYQL